jgi:hypothetical protein
MPWRHRPSVPHLKLGGRISIYHIGAVGLIKLWGGSLGKVGLGTGCISLLDAV